LSTGIHSRAGEISKVIFAVEFRADIINAQPTEFNMPYWRLFYHIVWSTKHRLPLIEPAWEEDLYGYLWGKATALGCIPHAINGISDHVHAALSIPPKLSLATTIGQLKGASSHHINQRYTGGAFMWQAEYGILSLSERSLARVVDYVKNQKQHHDEGTLDMAMENFGSSE
jgi:putative transposase